MLVIGLAGGTAPSREAIASRIHDSARVQTVVWALLGDRLHDGRARTLARSLERGQSVAPVMILSHVLTEEEAVVIRAHGGHVWHVFGPVSSAVVIRHGDLRVTQTEGGDRHWLDPIEALSESLLIKAREA
jgi:hypothetical protein